MINLPIYHLIKIYVLQKYVYDHFQYSKFCGLLFVIKQKAH